MLPSPRLDTSGRREIGLEFPISILVVGRAPDVGDGGGNQRLVGEQTISARVNISASIIAFYTPALTYPSPLLKRRGILSVKPKDKHVLYGY